MDKRLSHKEQKPSNPLGSVVTNNGVVTINATDMHYRDLNFLLKSHSNPTKRIDIFNVYGQRYIGTGLKNNVEIHIYGTPGNDLAAFMDGPTIYVHGNAQDGVGNTMNNGKVVVYGRAGDIVGYAMRGGKIFIRDDAGYRVGIHMKEYGDQKPILVVGGTAQDFLGEYMAGGILVVLGLTLNNGESHKAKFVGTGMHGGIIYVRGRVAHIGKEVKIMELEKNDIALLKPIIEEFCGYFNFDANKILTGEFKKLIPFSTRPYGRLYAQ
jgi:glutamate synthase domain-containing protein 3